MNGKGWPKSSSGRSRKFSKQEIAGYIFLAVVAIVVFGFILHPSK